MLLLPHRREGTLRNRVRARWAGAELDRQIAGGADPGADPLLKRRADRLVTPAFCAMLAAGLERGGGQRRQAQDHAEPPLFPCAAAAVRGARRELLAPRGATCATCALFRIPRGVAMAGRLITRSLQPALHRDVERGSRTRCPRGGALAERRPLADLNGMDLIAIAIAVAFFAAMLLLIEGLDRV